MSLLNDFALTTDCNVCGCGREGYIVIDDDFNEENLISLARSIYNAASDEQKKQITEKQK